MLNGGCVRRLRVVLDLILELKSSKSSSKKHTEPELEKVFKLRKWLGRVKSRTSSSNGSLNVTLKELLNADVSGRWWVVGGQWVGGRREGHVEQKDEKDQPNAKLMQLASTQRMNTDIRR